MIVAQYFVEFIFYSFLGWVWESIYCTINEKKWADRGFLFGPVCPIYGSCVVTVNILFGSVKGLSSPDFPLWGIFLICMAGSAVAEYTTSWVMEKRFHALWWDYSHVPLNLHGRICLPVSIAFGLAGIVVVKYVIPWISGMHTTIHPMAYEVAAIVFAMIFGADFALTEASLSTLLKSVEDYKAEFNRRAELTYTTLASAPKKLEQEMVNAKESLVGSIVQTKDTLVGGVSQKKENLTDSITNVKDNLGGTVTSGVERVKLLADSYVNRMNPYQIHILSNIKRFRTKDEENKVSGMSLTEHLKNALKRKSTGDATENRKEQQNEKAEL